MITRTESEWIEAELTVGLRGFLDAPSPDEPDEKRDQKQEESSQTRSRSGAPIKGSFGGGRTPLLWRELLA
jgi:hypothetical protein